MAANYVTKTIAIPHDGNWLARFHSSGAVHPGLGQVIPGTATNSLYLKADLYIPAASYSTMVSGLSEAIQVLNILEDGDALDDDLAWARFNLVNVGGAIRGWDDLSDAGERVTLSADTWYTIECGIRFNGSEYEVNFGVNGSYSDWDVEGSLSPGSVWSGIVIGSNISNEVSIGSGKYFYLDNVEVARNNWVEQGGTVVWSDDFNSGNFSEWDSVINTPTIAPNVDNTLAPKTVYISADVMIPTAKHALMVADATGATHTIMGLIHETRTVPNNSELAWEISNVSGTLKLQDYYTLYDPGVTISPNTWYTIELAVRPDPGANEWEANAKVDGVEGGWVGFDDGDSTLGWGTLVIGSFFGVTSTAYTLFDNVKIATDNWISLGGTPIFVADYEEGNLSEWDSTVGTPSVIAI